MRISEVNTWMNRIRKMTSMEDELKHCKYGVTCISTSFFISYSTGLLIFYLCLSSTNSPVKKWSALIGWDSQVYVLWLAKKVQETNTVWATVENSEKPGYGIRYRTEMYWDDFVCSSCGQVAIALDSVNVKEGNYKNKTKVWNSTKLYSKVVFELRTLLL